jgi:hypothetical protein
MENVLNPTHGCGIEERLSTLRADPRWNVLEDNNIPFTAICEGGRPPLQIPYEKT